jgi:putative transposase
MRLHPRPWDAALEKQYHRLFSDHVEAWLDAGAGSCVLRDPVCRRIVADAFHYFDGRRYVVWAYVVMPNHVHGLLSLCEPHQLEEVLHLWKSYTANKINRHLAQRGQLWHEEYWDRLIRSEAHFQQCVRYICENPLKAHLSGQRYTLFVRERSENDGRAK